VVLYFAAPDAAGLVPEIRWLPVGLADAKGRLEALVEGPKNAGLFPTLPSPLRIRSVTVEGDLAVVDFDGELVRRHPGGSAGEILTVFSVVNTLTEIPGVRRVAWRIDGRAVETLVGHLGSLAAGGARSLAHPLAGQAPRRPVTGTRAQFRAERRTLRGTAVGRRAERMG